MGNKSHLRKKSAGLSSPEKEEDVAAADIIADGVAKKTSGSVNDDENDVATVEKKDSNYSNKPITSNNDTKKASAATTTPAGKHTIVKKYERSPSAHASDLLRNTNADFLSIDRSDELEMVELIRRIAELVVLSERKAGQLICEAQDAAAAAVAAAAEAFAASRKEEGDDGRSRGQSTTGESTTKKKNDDVYSEDAGLLYLALVELFCERNALANIDNVVTGAAFVPDQQQIMAKQANCGVYDIYKRVSCDDCFCVGLCSNVCLEAVTVGSCPSDFNI